MGILRQVFPLGAILFAYKATSFLSTLGFFKNVEYASSDNCILIDGFDSPGSEDITEYTAGQYFVSSGDLHHLFGGGIEHAAPGGIYLVDVRTSPPRNTKLEVQGMPSDMVLQPHGIFYSRDSRTMFTVSHGFRKGGTRVQIFAVSDPGNDGPPTLVYSRSAPFENAVINDVIGISPHEFYVTRWLAMPLPVGGKLNPDTPEQGNALKVQTLKELAGISHECVVYHCKWNEWTTKPNTYFDDSHCTKALEGFITANGITISNDLKTVFVSDLLMQRINVYERNENDGSLTLTQEIALPHLVDNIEFSPSGDIFMGSITVPYIAAQHMETGGYTVPGGSLKLTRDPATTEYKLEDTYQHDGSMLSQISASFQYDGHVLLGSPFAQGLLYCPL